LPRCCHGAADWLRSPPSHSRRRGDCCIGEGRGPGPGQNFRNPGREQERASRQARLLEAFRTSSAIALRGHSRFHLSVNRRLSRLHKRRHRRRAQASSDHAVDCALGQPWFRCNAGLSVGAGSARPAFASAQACDVSPSAPATAAPSHHERQRRRLAGDDRSQPGRAVSSSWLPWRQRGSEEGPPRVDSGAWIHAKARAGPMRRRVATDCRF
jgi:hypothetical protein